MRGANCGYLKEWSLVHTDISPEAHPVFLWSSSWSIIYQKMYLKIWLHSQSYLETIPDDSGCWCNKWVHQSLEEITLGLFRHLQRLTFVNSQAEKMQITFQMTLINYTLSATWDARLFYVTCKGNFMNDSTTNQCVMLLRWEFCDRDTAKHPER